MSEWKDYKLKDVCLKITDGSHKSPKAQKTGFPMFSVKDMKEYGFSYDDCKLISADDFAEMKSTGCVPEKDDILIAKDGSYLKQIFICRETKEEAILSSIAIFRPNKKIVEPLFLMYLLKSPHIFNYIKTNCVSGSAIPRIVLKSFKDVVISVPESIEEQKRISEYFWGIDSKIECNQKICANIEAQAQALFKHWFIDFVPFKNGKFVESELGMIPEGWTVGNLFDISEIHDSKRIPLSGLQRSRMKKKIYPYYGATEQMDMVDNYIFDGRYVLMGEDGSVVRSNGLPYIQYVWGKIWVNNHAHVLSGKNGFTTEMLIPFLTKYNIKGLITGAVQAKLNQGNMAKIKLAIPPQSILNTISGYFDALFDIYRQCQAEIMTLAALRDTLLPKLMSGRIKL